MEVKSVDIGNSRLQRYQVEVLRTAANSDRLRHSDNTMTQASKSPIGHLLNNIATLPEIREDKVMQLRESIKNGTYDFDQHIDAAVDRVLEELIL